MALSAASTRIPANTIPHVIQIPLAAAVRVWQGAAVIIGKADAGTDVAGHARPLASALGGDRGSYMFVGIALETVDNRTGQAANGESIGDGTAGNVSVRVQVSGTMEFVTSSATDEWIGRPFYLTDDETGQTTEITDAFLAGAVTEFITATRVRVEMRTLFGSKDVSTARRLTLTETFEDLPHTIDSPGGTVTVSHRLNSTPINQPIVTARAPAIIKSITWRQLVAGTDAGAVTLMLEKAASTVAAGSGTDLMTGTIDLKTAADTVVNGTLAATAAITLAAGESVMADFGGTTTTNVDGIITVKLVYLPANRHFVLSGTNASDDDGTYHDGGGVTIQTDGADNDQAVIFPRSDVPTPWDDITFSPEDQLILEMRFRIGTVDVGEHILGLKLTSAVDHTTDADQVLIKVDEDDTDANWQVIDSIGGTDTTTDSGVDQATTEQVLQIFTTAARVAYVVLNGALVRTTSALTAGVALKPFFAVDARDANARSATLHKIELSKLVA